MQSGKGYSRSKPSRTVALPRSCEAKEKIAGALLSGPDEHGDHSGDTMQNQVDKRPAGSKRCLRLDEARARFRMLDHVVRGPRAWDRKAVHRSQWRLTFTSEAVAEILDM